MLPPLKRPPRFNEPSEVAPLPSRRRVAIRKTSEGTRLHHAPAHDAVDDDDGDDQTLLFPGALRTLLPARPKTPVALPVMPSMVKKAKAVDMGAVEGSATRGRVGSEASTGSARRPAKPTPPVPSWMPQFPAVKEVEEFPSAPPVSYEAPVESDASLPRLSHPAPLPSSVATSRTRLAHPRSALSWALALAAIGAVVGLVTALVARGDAAHLLDVTASLTDPSPSTPAPATGAVAQVALFPSFVETAGSTLAVRPPATKNPPLPIHTPEASPNHVGTEPPPASHVKAPPAFAAGARSSPKFARSTMTPGHPASR